MSCFYDKVTLENQFEAEAVAHGLMQADSVHHIDNTDAFVDCGAWTLVINEDIATQLGLEFKEAQSSEAAGGKTAEGFMAKPLVRVHCHGRQADVAAFVLPGQKDILLGALPMEIMDLWINPRTEALTPKNTKRMVM
jgi:predicted aspartyl protease